ncbi:MAG: PAS domain-containing protein [Capsulimonadaceae bacterium]|nr:PAS domain-containing protein [Capsulimonadaceae bacterium]
MTRETRQRSKPINTDAEVAGKGHDPLNGETHTVVVDSSGAVMYSTLTATTAHATLVDLLDDTLGRDFSARLDKDMSQIPTHSGGKVVSGAADGYAYSIAAVRPKAEAPSLYVITLTGSATSLHGRSIANSHISPFRMLADIIPQLLWIADEKHVMTYLNQRCAEYIGCPVEEILERGWTVFAAAQDVPRILERRRYNIEHQCPYELEFQFRRYDGVYRWFVSRAQTIFDAAGRFAGWIGTCTDIDDSKRAELNQRFLSDLGERLRGHSNPEILLNEAVTSLGQYLEVNRCGYSEIDLDRDQIHVQTDYVNGVPSVTGSHVRHTMGTFVDEMARGETAVINDCETDPRTRGSYENVLRPHEIRAMINVPILRDGRQVATLFVHDSRGKRKWTPHEITLIETLAERIWLTFENAILSRKAKELEARQRQLLAEVMRSVTGGKLTVCLSGDELPPPPSPPIATMNVDRTTGLKELRDLARSLARKLLFPTPRVHDLVTGVAEAAMNAIVHAGSGTVSIYASNRTIHVRIEDSGKGILDELIPRATIERGDTTAASLGHGFKMMLETIDRVWLLTSSKGTTVILQHQADAALSDWATLL